MIWNSQRSSEKFLLKLVELGGVVSRLESGDRVGRMVSREGALGQRKSPWQFQTNEKSTCWLWLRGKRKGYGCVWWDGMSRPASRLYYLRLVGPIHDELQIDHLCRNIGCVNPSHLEPVTAQVNTLRSKSPSSKNARKTRCIHGHPFFDQQVNIRGHRICMPCLRRISRKHYWKFKSR